MTGQRFDLPDRPAAIRTLAEKFGCTLVAFYCCFGGYGGVLISALKSTQLMTKERGMDAMRKAGSATFQVPTL